MRNRSLELKFLVLVVATTAVLFAAVASAFAGGTDNPTPVQGGGHTPWLLAHEGSAWAVLDLDGGIVVPHAVVHEWAPERLIWVDEDETMSTTVWSHGGIMSHSVKTPGLPGESENDQAARHVRRVLALIDALTDAGIDPSGGGQYKPPCDRCLSPPPTGTLPPGPGIYRGRNH